MTTCPTCGKRATRSSDANKRYWAIIQKVSENIKPNGQQFSIESWHEYMKAKFLGMQEFELPSGQTLVRANSSAVLDVGEFNDYMTKVEAWATENGVWLEE